MLGLLCYHPAPNCQLDPPVSLCYQSEQQPQDRGYQGLSRRGGGGDSQEGRDGLLALDVRGTVVTGCSEWRWLLLLCHGVSAALQGCCFAPGQMFLLPKHPDEARRVQMKLGGALPAFGMQNGDALRQWICSVPETKQLMLPEGAGARGSRCRKPSSSLCHSFQRTD